MFFVVFSFGPSCFLNDLQDSHLHRMANRWCIDAVWLNRCHTWEVPCTNVPIVDTSFPAGKNSSHSTGASGHSNETSRGSFAEDGWRPRARWTCEMIQQQHPQKKDTGWWKSFWVFRVLCLRLAENGLVALFWGSAFWGLQILCLSSWSQVHERYET